MKRNLWVLMVLGCVPLLTMCRPANVAPISKICEYDGAHSGTTVKVKCVGIGTSQETALVDAKKAATWYVVSTILQSTRERERFSSISRGFYMRYNTFLNKVDTDGTYKQDDQGKARVKASIHVNRDAIVKYLKDNEIVNEKNIRKKIGNPSVAVTARWKTKDPRWNAQVSGAAAEFLTSRQYNALDLESGQKKLNKFTQTLLKSEKLPVDKKFRASLMMGADVYLEITAWNDSRGAHTKGSARAKVYETTTGRLLGVSTAMGERYPIAQNQSEFKTIKEATQNATQKALEHVMKYWRDDVKDGNRYYIVLAGKLDAIQDMGDIISVRLKKMQGANNFKRTTLTAKRMTCTIQTKMDSTEMSLALKQTLRKTPGVKSLTVPISTRKFFLIVINHGGKASFGADSDTLPPGL